MRIALSLLILLTVVTGCDKEEVVAPSGLPSEITNYLAIHFPDYPVIQAIEEKENFRKSYEVYLDGGFKLEFDRKKKVTEVTGISKLPDSVVPASILSFVQSNYSQNEIVGWELDDRHQQIRLDNEMELEFNMDGEFLRID